jgi:hypothetical protein
MNPMDTKDQSNVNITLENRESYAKTFLGKLFPCPVCGMAVALRIASTGKPYCHCDGCAIQLFFRGKVGIERLATLLRSGVMGSAGASRAVVLYNRLLQLKTDRKKLDRQRLIFYNPDLEGAVRAIQKEIDEVRAELEKLSGGTERSGKQ